MKRGPFDKVKQVAKHLSETEIASYFPDKPYLLVFGTSHSFASCRKGDSTVIDNTDTWHSIVGKHLELPVVNLAVPGNTNQRITNQLLDVIDRGLLDRCVMVIAEVRASNRNGDYFSRDALAEWTTGREWNNPEMCAGRDIYAFSYLDSKLIHYAPGATKFKPNYYEGLVSSIWSDPDTIPEQALEDLEQYIKYRTQFFHQTNSQSFENFNYIRTIQSLCEGQDTLFRWFCWDQYSEQDDPEVDFYFKNFSRIFDTAILNQGMRTYADSQGVDLNKYQCECRHLDERGHSWIAKQIKQRLPQIL